MAEQCTHLDQIRVRHTDQKSCQECLKTGDTWVHLRLCLTCGHVGCCDSSKNKHATRHFHATKHPLIRSIEPGESWLWCYVDDLMAGELES
jgi:uncharacterized UBP type Zn finger protein